MFLGSKSRTAGAAICLLVSMFLSPFVPVASAAAPLDPHTLYFGVVTTTPIQSMADINQLNVWGVQSGGLSQFDSVLNVRPFYYLSSNDTFIGDFAQSYQVFPANDTYIVHYRTGSSWTNGDPLNAWDAYATAIILTGLGCPAFNYKVLNNYTLSIQIPHNPAVALDGISVSSPVFAIDNCAVGVLWNYKQYLPLVQQVLGNYSKIQS